MPVEKIAMHWLANNYANENESMAQSQQMSF